jgi:DNA-directed RNA polymerase subunit RPC12/RpoP
MPGLGIGVSTPFSQPSNYQTVLNHRFRDEAPYDPSKQTKMKCPYCGVWARKGRTCSLCGTQVPGAPPPQRMEQSRARSPAAGSNGNSARRGGRTSGDIADAPMTTPGRTGKPHTPGRTHMSTSEGIPNMSPGSSFYSSRDPQRRVQSPGQTFRRTTTPLSHGPDQQVRKVKCSYCGIWVPVGKICSLCRTQA